jgi:hypothetical protein
MLKQLDTVIGFVVVISLVSLMITIITQMVSSLLGLRGKNLADALEAMIHKIDPKIGEQAKALIDQVLTRPVISDSILSMRKNWPIAWKRATAIRPDELIQILQEIAGQTAAPAESPKTVPEAAAKLLASLDKASQETTEAIEELKKQLPGLALQKGADLVHELNAATNISLANLEKWFNSAQWFALHTRVITVVASLVTALILQLDTFELLKHISSDSDVRSKLLTTATTLDQQNQDALKEADPRSQVIHKEAISKIKQAYPEIAEKLDNPPQSTLMVDVDNWIRERLADDPKKDQIVTDYNDAVNQSVRMRLDSLSEKLGAVSDEFNKTGLELIPELYPPISGGKWSWPPLHLLGIIATAGLLSLGAPFRFNTLKSLTSLRPLLANEVDKDPKQIPQSAKS